jgi:formate dehydrogenase subunit delta
MDVKNLVKMANQIASFFETMPDREQALSDIASHIRRYWEPRMRRALLNHIDLEGGTDLNAMVLEAIQRKRTELA